MEDAIVWLKATELHSIITSNSWVWPSMEMVHFLGLCLLFGSLLFVDLRVIGVARKVPIKLVDIFILATLIGFSLNAITGVLFVVGDPGRYFVNIAFRLKMVLIVIAGLNALYFTFRIRPQIQAGADSSMLSADAKLVAGFSLFLWTSIIVLGRFIPYVEDL